MRIQYIEFDIVFNMRLKPYRNMRTRSHIIILIDYYNKVYPILRLRVETLTPPQKNPSTKKKKKINK